MALYVNTNISSLNSQRKLTNATNALNTTYQRLSSGLRINSAKDDAAGLQISDRMTSQINGLNQGNRNANDAIALAQTTEGAMDEITSMLQRIRTLAIQAGNGSNTQKDRDSIQQEVTALSQEITRIACRTTFNGQTILAGINTADDKNKYNGGLAGVDNLLDEEGKLAFQVGSNAYDTIEIDLSQGFSVYSLANYATLEDADGNSIITGGTTIDDRVLDEGTKVTSTSTGVVFQTINAGEPDEAQIARFSVSSQTAAQATLASIDAMIQVVDGKRAELGAMQNRLESTIRNQSSISENTSDARSRIRDTDFAEESANLTQQNIIQQASQTILTQANQRPQIALSLLQG